MCIRDRSSNDLSTDTQYQTGSLLTGKTQFDYDPMGNVVRTVSVNRLSPSDRFTTATEYDSWGNPIATIDNAGVTTMSSYDAVGRLKTSTDALGRTSNWIYDNVGRTKRVVAPDPDGSGPLVAPTTSYRYSARGELLSSTDQLGRTTLYEYDDFGRQVRVTLPDPDGDILALESPTIKNTYDKVGNLLTSVDESDARNVVTRYEYDNMHRVTKTILDADGSDAMVSTNEYDEAGRLVRSVAAYRVNADSTSPAPSITEYEYDSLNRVIVTTIINGHANLSNPSLPLQTRTTYAPNGLAIAQTIVDTDGGHSAWNVLVGDRTTQYHYDLAGRLLATELANGDTSYQTYDGFGRSHSVIDAAGNATTYVYDDQGLVFSETDQSGDVTLFDYSDNGLLESVTDRNGRIRTYEYDDLDRMTFERWLDPNDNTSVIQTYAWTYNDAGLAASAGDDSQTYTYSYDDLDRLTGNVRSDSELSLIHI